jgi:hypothetical protein
MSHDMRLYFHLPPSGEIRLGFRVLIPCAVLLTNTHYFDFKNSVVACWITSQAHAG